MTADDPTPTALLTVDADAWQTLFREEFARVVAVCRSLGAADPEDVAQEAFSRTYLALGRIAPGAVRGYVYVTAVNQVRDRGRKRSLLDHGFSLVPPDGPAADDLATRRVDGEPLRRAVRALGVGDRQVVVLRYWAGLTDGQIADHLGLRPGTVRSRLSRALRRLADRHPDLRPVPEEL